MPLPRWMMGASSSCDSARRATASGSGLADGPSRAAGTPRSREGVGSCAPTLLATGKPRVLLGTSPTPNDFSESTAVAFASANRVTCGFERSTAGAWRSSGATAVKLGDVADVDKGTRRFFVTPGIRVAGCAAGYKLDPREEAASASSAAYDSNCSAEACRRRLEPASPVAEAAAMHCGCACSTSDKTGESDCDAGPVWSLLLRRRPRERDGAVVAKPAALLVTAARSVPFFFALNFRAGGAAMEGCIGGAKAKMLRSTVGVPRLGATRLRNASVFTSCTRLRRPPSDL